MKCSKCGSENKNGRKHCWKCGEMLRIICTVCGFENETDALFCGGCGKKLGEEDRIPFDVKTQDSPSDDIKEEGITNIDTGKIFSADGEEKSGILKDEGKKMPVEESEENREKEDVSSLQMSQEEIEKLFKENEKEDNKKEVTQEKKDIDIESNECGSRHVGKHSSSRLDAPITQDELDKMLEGYKKKHGIK